MYLLAFAAFWGLGYLRIRKGSLGWRVEELSDLCFYAAIGVIVGGRLGFTVFYGFERLMDQPMWLFYIWEGGMSFHGGLLGVIGGIAVFCRLKNKGFWTTIDAIAPLVPLGLGIGRIGNFINTELPGRVTDFALGVHFPCSSVLEHNFLCTGMYEQATRHLSSLYQATAEGLVLFTILWFYSQSPKPLGRTSGLFLVTYGVIRIITELFREPDAHMGFVLFDLLTMGQALSILMILTGVGLWFTVHKYLTPQKGTL